MFNQSIWCGLAGFGCPRNVPQRAATCSQKCEGQIANSIVKIFENSLNLQDKKDLLQPMPLGLACFPNFWFQAVSPVLATVRLSDNSCISDWLTHGSYLIETGLTEFPISFSGGKASVFSQGCCPSNVPRCGSNPHHTHRSQKFASPSEGDKKDLERPWVIYYIRKMVGRLVFKAFMPGKQWYKDNLITYQSTHQSNQITDGRSDNLIDLIDVDLVFDWLDWRSDWLNIQSVWLTVASTAGNPSWQTAGPIFAVYYKSCTE
jgi:hypothetical protein